MKKVVVILGLSVLTVISCKKEGPAGKDGKNGANGNANVHTYFFDTVSWNGGNTIIVDLPNVTGAQYQNDAFLEYASIGNGIFYPAQGPGPNATYQYRSYYWLNGVITFVLRTHNWDGTAYNGADSIHQLKIVHIESSDQQVLGINKKGNATDRVIEELTKNGINPNDYEAVCNYYGVEPN